MKTEDVPVVALKLYATICRRLVGTLRLVLEVEYRELARESLDGVPMVGITLLVYENLVGLE